MIVKTLLLFGAVVSVNSQQFGYGYPLYAPYPYQVQNPPYSVNQPQNPVPWYPQLYNGYIPQQQQQQPVYYPYPYNYYPVTNEVPNEVETVTKNATEEQDPYSNVATEIIDIDPVNFNQIMQQLGAEPRIVSYETRVVRNGGARTHPRYKVTTEVKKSNNTYAPNSIHRYQVSNKVYTFNKTYVLHPGQEKQVINLNFLNGEQITEKTVEEDVKTELPTTTVRTTTEIVSTTTESDEPDDVLNWFK